MKNSVFDNDMISFDFTKAIARGRKERSRAFHQLWKAAIGSIR